MFTRTKVLVAISLSSALFLLVALFLLSSNLGRVIRNGLVILGPVVTRTAWSLVNVWSIDKSKFGIILIFGVWNLVSERIYLGCKKS